MFFNHQQYGCSMWIGYYLQLSPSNLGSSGLLVLLPEFVSSLCLALCGLIATEGQLSLHITVLLSLFSGALTSQPGLLISRTRDALYGESDLKTLFDVLSVSYAPDDSGDLDLDAAVQSTWLGFCLFLRYLMLVGAVLSLISEPLLLAVAGGEVVVERNLVRRLFGSIGKYRGKKLVIMGIVLLGMRNLFFVIGLLAFYFFTAKSSVRYIYCSSLLVSCAAAVQRGWR